MLDQPLYAQQYLVRQLHLGLKIAVGLLILYNFQLFVYVERYCATMHCT